MSLFICQTRRIFRVCKFLCIELILRGLGIGVGDEVIIPTNSYIATAYAVSRTGAKPVFVDNDEFYLINTNEVKKKISKKTKAIIAVNLYGQKADLKILAQISKQNSLYLIEDSAQSHGARNSKFSNNYSIGAAYSFYPGKNLGAWGDGGAVTTDNKKHYEKMKEILVDSESGYLYDGYIWSEIISFIQKSKYKELEEFIEQSIHNKV